jgi:phosphatidylinositol alpha-mannosyltransferase
MRKNPGLSVGLVFDDSLDSSDGVAQYVKTVGAWLSGQGHEVTYIVGQSRTEEWAGGRVVSASRNLRVRWGGNRLSMPVWPDRSKIKRLLEERKFDILHVQVPYSPLMAQYVINRCGGDTAIVGTFHVYPANRRVVVGSRLLKLVYGRSLKRFDAMLAVSEAGAAYAAESFGLRTSILPNVIDLTRFKNKSAKDPARPTIVFLGRLVERKGAMYLLKAFSQLTERLPDAELVIAGRGPLRPKLESFVRRRGLMNQVRFLGFIEEDEKPALLGSTAIACFPSLYGESFGIVLIEAMAAGAGTVLGGDNPGYASVLGQQPDLLIDPTDTNAFADRLELLITDTNLTRRLHSWQSTAVKRYDIELVGPALLDIYREQIAKRTKKSNN